MVREAPSEVTITFKTPGESKKLPPVAANYFSFTFSVPEIQMLVGYVDLTDLVVTPGQSKVTVTPMISHRLALSLRGFLFLKKQIDEIWEKMDQAGLLRREEEQKQ